MWRRNDDETAAFRRCYSHCLYFLSSFILLRVPKNFSEVSTWREDSAADG